MKLAQLMKLFAEIDRLTYQPCPAGPHHHSHHPVLICGDMNIEPFSRLYKFVRRGKLTLNGQPAAKLSGQERTWRYGRHSVMPGFLDQHAGLTDQSQYVSLCQQRFGKVLTESNDAIVDDEPCKETPMSDALPVFCINAGNTQEKPVFTQGSGIVSHKFGLHSVYSHHISDDDGKGRHHEVTTCHRRANCTVDYIFYTPSVSDVGHSENGKPDSPPQTTHSSESSDEMKCKLSASDSADSLSSDTKAVSQQSSVRDENVACHMNDCRLTLIARLQLLSNQEMKQIGQLPNKFISSDHLILAAQFMLTSS